MKTLLISAVVLGVLLVGGHSILVVGGAAGGGGGVPAAASGNGDVNGSGAIDLSDVLYLLGWLFLGGPEPVAIGVSPELEARVGALEGELQALKRSLPADAGPFQALAQLLDPSDPPKGLPSGALQQVACGKALAAPASFSVNGSALGEVMGFVGREAISCLFDFLVAVRLPAASLAPEGLVGSSGQIVFVRGGRRTVWSGVISEARLSAVSPSGAVYVARLAPALEKLRRNTGYAIFQGALSTVPEVLKSVLGGADVPLPAFSLSALHERREFVVQYNESEMDFVSRLLEDEGIFYFFREGAGGHQMVVGDSNAAFQAPAEPLNFYGDQVEPPTAGEEAVRTLARSARNFPARASVRGYDMPRARIFSVATDAAGGDGELYEFTALEDDAQAKAVSSTRLAEALARRVVLDGTSNAAGLRAGHRITVKDLSGGGFDGEYYVSRVTHVFLRTDAGGTTCFQYGNQFACLPSSQPFRPARLTPRPDASGTVSGVVTGPPGETLYTDALGRVKVQFHWDRDSSADQNSSAWIRVATPYAGAGHGVFFLPEVGDEVLVAFEHGDPSHPVIIGSLWNGVDRPPVNLPAQKTTSVLRTRGPLDLSSPLTAMDGKLLLTANADPQVPLATGERHRDNALVAWARVQADGTMGVNELGVSKVGHAIRGEYDVALDARAVGALTLIPVATPLLAVPPATPDTLRIASVSPQGVNTFRVFINDGLGRPVDGAFIFMATAR